MTKHKWWCSSIGYPENYEEPTECDCDVADDEEYQKDRKEAKKELIRKAHKQFKRENKR